MDATLQARGILLVFVMTTGCREQPASIPAFSPPPDSHAITLPNSTPFDADAGSRSAYLTGFIYGYTSALTGRHVVFDDFGRLGETGRARAAGIAAGSRDASRLLLEMELGEIQKRHAAEFRPNRTDGTSGSNNPAISNPN